MNKVLFIGEHGDSPSGYYRLYIPALGLKANGWMAGTAPSVVFDPMGLEPATGFNGEALIEPRPDVIVMRRVNDAIPGTMTDSGVFQSMAKSIKGAQKQGQRIYIDLDDDPWNVPEWAPAYGNLKDYEMALWAEDMAQADGVICSTPAIAESVNKHSPDAATFVCRNGIDVDAYRYRRNRGNGRFRLAWMGDTAHRARDFQQVSELLGFVLGGAHDDVELWHLGWNPLNPSIRDLLGERFPVQVVEKMWTPILDLPKTMSEIDALIIPMEDTPFNRARSNVTGLAAAAAGVPFAAPTWHEEYRRLWAAGAGYPLHEHGEGMGILFAPAYEVARTDMATGGRAVAHLYDPKRTAQQYINAFNGLDKWLRLTPKNGEGGVIDMRPGTYDAS